MEKPKKKTFNSQASSVEQSKRDASIYNQGRQDMIDYLPSKEEIADTVYCITAYLNSPDETVAIVNKLLTEVISKRIGNDWKTKGGKLNVKEEEQVEKEA